MAEKWVELMVAWLACWLVALMAEVKVSMLEEIMVCNLVDQTVA
jgi:hypothetical protein